MKIFTRNSKGQKVCVEYEQQIITEPEVKSDIVIDDSYEGYRKFKLCLRRSQEENKYAYGMGDKRYDRALAELLHSNYDVYMKFQDMLRDELSNRK